MSRTGNTSTKLIEMVVIIAVLITSGCVSKSEPETAPSITPVLTPYATAVMITPAPTATPAPVQMPSDSLKTIFDNKNNIQYVKTTSSKIYAGELNGEYVSFVAQVFSVKPRVAIKDLDNSEFEVIDFQVWGNPLSRDEPMFIETMPIKINGTIRDGMNVVVEGYVSKEWMSGTNAYGGTIHQPFIYAHNITVIPDRVPE